MMKVGFAILAHQHPAVVARLARLLIQNGGLVAIHYDAKSDPRDIDVLKKALGNYADRVFWARRVRVGWGEWSIVQATLNVLTALEKSGESLDYVHLMSAADYPIRPLSDFYEYLERRRGFDFIECSDMMTENWVKSGLTHERYQYRHLFNERARKDLFELSWKIQHRWGLKRSLPSGLRPYIGSQWWTLTWNSVKLILAAGRERRLRSFFKTVWIPDEMFIQTVYGSRLPHPQCAPILTLYQFSDDGVPVVYYNDHADYLSRQPFFFASKISPYADRLRDALDEIVTGTRLVKRPSDKSIGIRTDEYETYRVRGRQPLPGVRLLGHEKDHWHGDLSHLGTPVLGVFGASHEELRGIARVLNQTGKFLCHGALFHPDRIEFVEGVERYAGYARDNVAIRDNRRTNFLADIAKEAPAGVAVGFLAPWDMDDEIRARLKWCGFARNVIVKGNVIRALAERSRRKEAMSPSDETESDEVIAAPLAWKCGLLNADDGITYDEFQRFEQSYQDYYSELKADFKEASTPSIEIDLLEPGWKNQLLEFLTQQVLPPAHNSAAFRAGFLRAASSQRSAGSEELPTSLATARRLTPWISEDSRRIGHLRDFARGLLRKPDQIAVVLLGASREELRFLARVLEHVGALTLQEPSIIDQPLGLASSNELDFPDKQLVVSPNDAFSRSRLSPLHFPEKESHHAVGFLASWEMQSDEFETLALWCQGSRALIVRGNVFRAFDDRRPSYANRLCDDRDEWKPQSISVREFESFMDECSHYHDHVRETCDLAQIDCFEIDLMRPDWLWKALDYLECHDSHKRRDIRDFIIAQAARMKDPFAGISNPLRLIAAIKDEERRDAHRLAYASRPRRNKQVSDSSPKIDVVAL